MSRGACITLGTFSLVSGIGVLLLTTVEGFEEGLPYGKYPIIGIAIFAAIIGWACLFRWSRPVTLRIVGAIVCAAYITLVASQWGDLDMIEAAITGLISYGVPGAYVAMTGRYPIFGSYAAVFCDNETDRQETHRNFNQ